MTVACWVCGSSNVVLWRPRTLMRSLVPDDLRVTDDAYGRTLTLWRCRACGFGFADANELVELSSLYERMSDAEYESSQDVRARQMRWVLRQALEAHPTAHTVLDVGAGAGTLIAQAERIGLEAVGVEPSRAFVRQARAASHADVVQGIFPHPAIAGRTFDLVFMVDVIEHVPDPVALLAAGERALAPGGVLVVITPDCGSVAARRLHHRWWHYRVAHVGYFSHHSLRVAVKRASLRVVAERRPVWYFRVRNLARRAAAYVPLLKYFNAVAIRVPPLSWLYALVIPVNLRDSTLLVLRRAGEPATVATPSVHTDEGARYEGAEPSSRSPAPGAPSAAAHAPADEARHAAGANGFQQGDT